MPASTDLIRWSAWQPLFGSWAGPLVPRQPGLYRIRRQGRDDLDYIGQPSRSLRGRLGMLRGVYAPELPYRDPHTAGPGLWALQDVAAGGGAGWRFEAAVAPLARAAPERKGGGGVGLGL